MPVQKPDEKPEEVKAVALVKMRHEVTRYKHHMAIGEAWFDVDDEGYAEFPLDLVEAAETAGFRRIG